MAEWDIALPGARRRRTIHLLIDSPGLRTHVGHLRKPPKRRAWRRLHLAVDADTGEIVASDQSGRLHRGFSGRLSFGRHDRSRLFKRGRT